MACTATLALSPIVAGLLRAAPAQGLCLLCTLSTTTPVVTLSNFAPGQTATGTGTLLATTVLGTSWSLSVQDGAPTAPGHLAAAAIGCSGSEANLSNPLNVAITSPPTGVTSAGPVAVSGVGQTIASSNGLTVLSNTPLTESFTQVIPTTDSIRAGCVYSITLTFTLQ